MPQTDLASFDFAIFDLIFYYVFTLIVITLLGRSVQKRAGAGSMQDNAMKGPRFVSMLIMSGAAIAVLLLFVRSGISPSVRTYIGVPYFAVLVYTMTTYFRQIKSLRKENGGRG